MQLVVLKIQALKDWLTTYEDELKQMMDNYPYISYRFYELANIYQNKLRETINHIKKMTSMNQQNKITAKYIISTQINQKQKKILNEVQEKLQILKYKMLGATIKHQLSQVQTNKQELIHILELIYASKVQNQMNSGQKKLQANFKQQNPKLVNLEKQNYFSSKPQTYHDYKSKYLLKRQNQAYRTQKIKQQLYVEMNQYLNHKKSIQTNNFNQYVYLTPTQPQNYNKLDKLKYKPLFLNDDITYQRNQSRNINNYSPRSNTNYKRKNYRYLQQFQKQYNQNKNHNQIQNLYSTPLKIEKYKFELQTEPSTKRISHGQQQDELGNEMDELWKRKQQKQADANIEFIKLLEFESHIDSNIEDPVIRIQYDQDSFEQGEKLSNNDDSLEIMKKQQKFNETGEFGLMVPKIDEIYEYSFSG